MRFLRNLIFKIFFLLLINAFILSGPVYPAPQHGSFSCLSPAVSLDADGFSRGFSGLYYSESVIAARGDRINYRLSFAKNDFNLTFRILFPEILQKHLRDIIVENFLSAQEENTGIKSIEVNFDSSEDPYINAAYKLFQQLGEQNLDKSIGAKELIDFLLGMDGNKRIDFAGFHPPRRGSKSRDAYIKKWLAAEISGMSTYTQKELRKKQNNQLWIIYYKFKLAHRFGKEFKASVEKGSEVIFKIVLIHKDGTVSRNEVILGRKEGRISAWLANPVVKALSKTGSEGIRERFPVAVRTDIHILESQREELKHTCRQSERLELVLAEFRKKHGRISGDELRSIVAEAIAWLSRTISVENKFKALDSLKAIAAEDGLGESKNYKKSEELIDNAVKALRHRQRDLNRMIQIANKRLKEYAEQNPDAYLEAEIIRNRLCLVQSAVILGDFSSALENITNLVPEMTAQELDRSWIEAKRKVEDDLQALAAGKSAEEAMQFITKINDRIVKQASNLREISVWFRARGFTIYASQLDTTASALENISAPGNIYADILKKAQENLEAIVKSSQKSARIAPDLKAIIEQRVSAVSGILINLRQEMIPRRNVLIRNALPGIKLTSLAQTLDILAKKTADPEKIYSRKELFEDLETLADEVAFVPNGHLGNGRAGEMVSIGEIAAKMMKRFIGFRDAGNLVLQAI